MTKPSDFLLKVVQKTEVVHENKISIKGLSDVIMLFRNLFVAFAFLFALSTWHAARRHPWTLIADC